MKERYTVKYKATRSQLSSSTIHGWWVLSEDDKPITGFLEREWAERIAAALNAQESACGDTPDTQVAIVRE